MKEQKQKHWKRWFSILLTVIFCFTLLPATAYAKAEVKKNTNIQTSQNPGQHKYDANWVYWSQGASRYGGKMQSSGCRVVSQAKLLMETGIVTDPSFNPDVFIEWGYANGYFGDGKNPFTTYIGEQTSGLAPVNYAKKLGKTLILEKTVSLTGDNATDVNTVMNYINQGYYVILGCAAHHAYVHRGKSLEKGTPYLADSFQSYSYQDNLLLPFKGYPSTSWGKGICFTTARLYKVGNSTSNSGTTTAITYTAPIKDGTYTLTPKHATGMRLDVNGASKDSGANVQIYKANNSDAQKFTFKHLGNGYYSITSVASGKVLDVAGGHTQAGTNVQQWVFGNSSAQRWKLKDAGSGYYYLVPALNESLCLDVANSGTQDKTNVLVWTSNQQNNQKWKLTATTVTANQNTTSTNNTATTTAPATKTYYVYNTDGTLVMRKGPGSSYAQQTLIPEGAAVTVTPSKNNGSWWYVTYNGKSGYTYSKYLTTSKPTAIIKDGTYTLAPKHATNMRLDVNGASKDSGANVQIYKANNTDAQKFTFKHLGNNYYSITCVASGKVLDVAGGHTQSGTNVQQWVFGNSSAQRWKLKDAGNGYYYLIPALNESLALDVSGAGTADKTNVQVWTQNQSNAQKWLIK